MNDSRKVVKVFLASPGDLQAERRSAKMVVEEFNSLWADKLGYQVELVGWEDTVTGFGRPQAIINRDLERCELFIGMIWRRWGTPPDVSGLYTSGFEEEFRTSVQRRKGAGYPEINLFFKEVEADLLRDPGGELKKVLDFKNEIIDGKTIYFETFASEGDFQEKIRRSITRYVQGLIDRDFRNEQGEDQTRSSEITSTGTTPANSDAGETSFSGPSAKFLREVLSKFDSASEENHLTPLEIARFRLLGDVVRTNANDERSLGVHDANLLYANRQEIEFSNLELHGLVGSGLEHYQSENAPLWYWVGALDGFNKELLAHYSVMGSTSERVSAISAMRAIAEPIDTGAAFSRQEVLEAWLAKDAPITLKLAALRYLGDHGLLGDLPAIRAEFDGADYSTRNAALEAILRIAMRESRERALRTLIELQPETVANDLLQEIFDRAASLPQELLKECVQHRSADVRRIATKVLRERRALSDADAERLISDDNAEVRFEALLSLVRGGRSFSTNEVKRILVKVASGNRGLLIGALGGRDTAGEAAWERFKELEMESLTDQELGRVIA